MTVVLWLCAAGIDFLEYHCHNGARSAGNGKEALMGDDEVEVRAAAERLVAAFGSGRLDDYFACFADHATFVFYTTPQRQSP